MLRLAESDVVAKRSERRLSAILLADVAGYSRLVGEDEEGTLAQWKAHWRDLIEPKIGDHDGRLVRTTGDGMLVEFASVVSAVRCAVEIQRGMAERNAGITPEKRMEFRVGINFGDIIIDGDDMWGDGINVAARLETLAEPGGICVSGRVQEDVQGKLDITFEDEGSASSRTSPGRCGSIGSGSRAAVRQRRRSLSRTSRRSPSCRSRT